MAYKQALSSCSVQGKWKIVLLLLSLRKFFRSPQPWPGTRLYSWVKKSQSGVELASHQLDHHALNDRVLHKNNNLIIKNLNYGKYFPPTTRIGVFLPTVLTTFHSPNHLYKCLSVSLPHQNINARIRHRTWQRQERCREYHLREVHSWNLVHRYT